MESPINKKRRFYIAPGFLLIAFLFNPHSSFGQVPKLLLKFAEKQTKIASGHIKLQETDIYDNDPPKIHTEEAFFISTPKNLTYLSYHQKDSLSSNLYGKLFYTIAVFYKDKKYDYAKFRYADDIMDAKYNTDFRNAFSYQSPYGFPLERWKKCIIQRISPKINKKNIRYKIMYPDDDVVSNSISEWEFNRKTFHWVQKESSGIYFNLETYYNKIDILEDHLYEYIHPDILDTINFKYEELRKGYELQCAVEQAKKDSVFRDSIAVLMAQNDGAWVQEVNKGKDTVFFMPEWKFPSLSGDTIYSDSIKSRFLFIDLWYSSCHPCRLSMRELASIDTVYDESLFKIISINVFDKDTAKMSRVVENLNLKSEVACAFGSKEIFELSRKMGESRSGYPQLYLIDMKTRKVVWYSFGWNEGFTKDIGEIITGKQER